MVFYGNDIFIKIFGEVIDIECYFISGNIVFQVIIFVVVYGYFVSKGLIRIVKVVVWQIYFYYWSCIVCYQLQCFSYFFFLFVVYFQVYVVDIGFV